MLNLAEKAVVNSGRVFTAKRKTFHVREFNIEDFPWENPDSFFKENFRYALLKGSAFFVWWAMNIDWKTVLKIDTPSQACKSGHPA